MSTRISFSNSNSLYLCHNPAPDSDLYGVMLECSKQLMELKDSILHSCSSVLLHFPSKSKKKNHCIGAGRWQGNGYIKLIALVSGVMEEVSNREVPVVPLDAEQSIWEKRLFRLLG